MMQDEQSNLFTRSDTFFGVCEGMGEDLRINPFFLRIALTALLFLNPLAALVTYAAAGALVLATRLLIPNPRAAVAQQAEPIPAAATAEGAPADENERQRVPLAA